MYISISSEQIIEVIFEAIRILNEQLPPDQKLTVSSDLVLVGDSGKLDSLQFVNFVLALEQNLKSELGIDLILTDNDVLSNQEDIFASVQTLGDYIGRRIIEKSRDKR